MKIFFFLVLLSNIIFFLWEFNSVQIDNQVASSRTEEKQIFLLAELAKKENISDVDEQQFLEKVEVGLGNQPIKSSDAVSKVENAFIDGENAKILSSSEQQELLSTVGPEISNSGDIKLSTTENIKSLGIETEFLEEKIKLSKAAITNDFELATDQAVVMKTDSEDNTKTVKETSFCYQVGPFLREEALLDWLEENSIDLTLVTKLNKDIKKVTGFLVYYPKADTYEASKSHIQLLESKAVNDFWLFRKGELKGHISLGLFVKERRALLLQQKLLDMGVNAAVMTRYKTEVEWYAKVLAQKGITSEKESPIEKQVFSTCDNI